MLTEAGGEIGEREQVIKEKIESRKKRHTKVEGNEEEEEREREVKRRKTERDGGGRKMGYGEEGGGRRSQKRRRPKREATGARRTYEPQQRIQFLLRFPASELQEGSATLFQLGPAVIQAA